MNPVHLSDLEFGDVISDKDGVLVVHATAGGTPCVVKRYATEEHRREISNYTLLAEAGVPTLPILGHGDDWIAIAEVHAAGFRLGTEDDAADPAIARQLAHWYAALHAAGTPERLDGLYRETDLITAERLALIADVWPQTAPGLAVVERELPVWREQLAEFDEVLTYNDFWWTNLAVDLLGGSALMFDYNLLGRGYRYADVRNVTLGLTAPAADAFRHTYEELAGPLDPRELAVDEPVSHFVTLITAARLDPDAPWAGPSKAWLTGLRTG